MRPLFLIDYALEALTHAYAPYSNFSVGAALLAKNGHIYTGCNIENTAFSPSVCAERVAFYKAISEGVMDFEAIAIVGRGPDGFKHYCYPCGVCRQVMAEFCTPDFKIYLSDDRRQFETYTLAELLPHQFDL